MYNYKINSTATYTNIGNAYHGYTGKITHIGYDYIVISNESSSLIIPTMKNLTEHQSIMLNELYFYKNEKYPHQRDIELSGGNWLTARSLEEKGLVEIYRNELGQNWVKLKGENNE